MALRLTAPRCQATHWRWPAPPPAQQRSTTKSTKDTKVLLRWAPHLRWCQLAAGQSTRTALPASDRPSVRPTAPTTQEVRLSRRTRRRPAPVFVSFCTLRGSTPASHGVAADGTSLPGHALAMAGAPTRPAEINHQEHKGHEGPAPVGSPPSVVPARRWPIDPHRPPSERSTIGAANSSHHSRGSAQSEDAQAPGSGLCVLCVLRGSTPASHGVAADGTSLPGHALAMAGAPTRPAEINHQEHKGHEGPAPVGSPPSVVPARRWPIDPHRPPSERSTIGAANSSHHSRGSAQSEDAQAPGSGLCVLCVLRGSTPASHGVAADGTSLPGHALAMAGAPTRPAEINHQEHKGHEGPAPVGSPPSVVPARRWPIDPHRPPDERSTIGAANSSHHSRGSAQSEDAQAPGSGLCVLCVLRGSTPASHGVAADGTSLPGHALAMAGAPTRPAEINHQKHKEHECPAPVGSPPSVVPARRWPIDPHRPPSERSTIGAANSSHHSRGSAQSEDAQAPGSGLCVLCVLRGSTPASHGVAADGTSLPGHALAMAGAPTRPAEINHQEHKGHEGPAPVGSPPSVVPARRWPIDPHRPPDERTTIAAANNSHHSRGSAQSEDAQAPGSGLCVLCVLRGSTPASHGVAADGTSLPGHALAMAGAPTRPAEINHQEHKGHEGPAPVGSPPSVVPARRWPIDPHRPPSERSTIGAANSSHHSRGSAQSEDAQAPGSGLCVLCVLRGSTPASHGVAADGTSLPGHALAMAGAPTRPAEINHQEHKGHEGPAPVGSPPSVVPARRWPIDPHRPPGRRLAIGAANNSHHSRGSAQSEDAQAPGSGLCVLCVLRGSTLRTPRSQLATGSLARSAVMCVCAPSVQDGTGGFDTVRSGTGRHPARVLSREGYRCDALQTGGRHGPTQSQPASTQRPSQRALGSGCRPTPTGS